MLLELYIFLNYGVNYFPLLKILRKRSKWYVSGVQLGPRQMSKMESFATIVNGYKPLHVFYNKQLHFWVKVRVAQQITFLRLKVAQEMLINFQRHKGYVKLTIFLLLPVFALISLYTSQLSQKHLWKNLASVNLFTQSSTKFYCVRVFNVGGCLASCLTLGPQQLGCL